MKMIYCLFLMVLTNISCFCTAERNYTNGSIQFYNLSTIDDIMSVPSYVCDFSSDDCTTWSYCDIHGICKCFQNDNLVFICDVYGRRISILSCYCLTLNSEENATEVGVCVYNCNSIKKIDEFGLQTQYSLLPTSVQELEDVMCGAFNRTGSLCGSCKEGTYTRAYSYDMSCISCEPSWFNVIKYIAIAFMPLTFFYLLVLYIQVNISLSRIQGFVLFSQCIASPLAARSIFVYLTGNMSTLSRTLVKTFGTFFGVWNLDFLRVLNFNICLSIEPLAILSLDFVVAVYPLFLMVITYIIAAAYDSRVKVVTLVMKPFIAVFSLYKNNWNVRTSLIDSFSTFMVLCHVKVSSTCSDLLIPVHICDTSSSNKCRLALLYDASIPYFGDKHFPYAILAICVLLVLIVFPILLLLFYQCNICRHILSVLLPSRCKLILHTFMESIQGCYKDGTETGYQDYRWFSAMSFLVHVFLLGIYSSILLVSFFPLGAMILVVYATIVIIADPYKSRFNDISTSVISFVLLLATGAIIILQFPSVNEKIIFPIALFMLVFQIVYVAAITFKWINSHRRFKISSITFDN